MFCYQLPNTPRCPSTTGMQFDTPVIKQNGFVLPDGGDGLYNDGNDSVSNMNKFAFPAISFSPSFPLSMSIGGPRVPSNSLISPSPPSSVAPTKVLSPRSAHRGADFSASSGSPANQSQNAMSPPSNSTSSSLLSVLFSLDSPLPPLSPRGQKLADSVQYHNAKCLNRLVEKRRKASDGTEEIVAE